MTPISFALSILLDCETIEEAHKKCRKYIKHLEASEGKSPRPPAIQAQAPSTQRLMEQHPVPPPIIVPQRIVGGDVDNGDGTRGKRKF